MMSVNGLLLVLAAIAVFPSSSDAFIHLLANQRFPLKFQKSRGEAVNCGTVPFNISWTPKELHPSDIANVYVSYKVPHNFKSGFLNANVSFHGDDQPFMGIADQVTCDDLEKYTPVCPIPQGFFINKTFEFRDLHVIASYTGSYDGIASLKNQDGKEMFCIKATITLDQL